MENEICRLSRSPAAVSSVCAMQAASVGRVSLVRDCAALQ